MTTCLNIAVDNPNMTDAQFRALYRAEKASDRNSLYATYMYADGQEAINGNGDKMMFYDRVFSSDLILHDHDGSTTPLITTSCFMRQGHMWVEFNNGAQAPANTCFPTLTEAISHWNERQLEKIEEINANSRKHIEEIKDAIRRVKNRSPETTPDDSTA